MARYVANRLAQAIMLLVIVSALGFAILHLAPGGPLSQFAASAQMTQEDLDRVTKQLGLDRPLPIQYLDWFGRMLQGRLGPLLSRQRACAVRDRLASRRHARIDGDRDRDRGSARLLDRRARRRAPLFAVRFTGDRRRHDRALDSDVLVRAGHDLHLFGQPRLAAVGQPADHRRRLIPRSAASSDRAGASCWHWSRPRSGDASCAPRCSKSSTRITSAPPAPRGFRSGAS